MKPKFKNYQPLIMVGVIFTFLLGLIIFAFINFINTFSEVNKVQSDVDNLNRKLSVLESNKALTQSQISDYNKLLTQLIPDHEDYFSILFALEQLSNKTHFSISKYAIQLSSSSPEKLQVIVEGNGDSDNFLNFLKDYKFAGGRFITNESISFSSARVGQISLTLNFYNKKVSQGTGELTKLTPQQIQTMNEIQSKTTVSFKEDESVSASYPTKNNPF